MASKGIGPLVTYHYMVHGLTVQTNLIFPELGVTSNGAVDLEIFVGECSKNTSCVGNAGSGIASFNIPNVGTFTIADGKHIHVDPAAGVHEQNLRLFILGSAMGLALHQRGIFALHAAAALIDGKAVAITGRSGAGKSTIALAFAEAGFPVLSDDVLAIRTTKDGLNASRAVRRIRLCPDALHRFDHAPKDYPPSYVGEPELAKHDFGIGEAPEQARLVTVIELADGSAKAEQIFGADAVELILANSFRGSMAELGQQRRDQYASAVAIATNAEIYRLHRPRDLNRLPDLVHRIADIVRQVD